MDDHPPQVPDDPSSIVSIGDVTIPIVDDDDPTRRDWGEPMKRVQLLKDEELFSAVSDPHPGARCEALLRLRARCGGDRRTLPILSKATQDQDSRVRETALVELRNLFPSLTTDQKEQVALTIRNGLKDPHEDVRTEARYALHQLGVQDET